MKFTYRSGQRPLAGYTIKRGVGQGTFGEVYFAVSDGGKEVALKLLRGHNLDAELRGIGFCLNLKHPHLVHLYDMLTDDAGRRWVVMEYVFGESLAQVINRHPSGLTVELAKDWFAALARGVGYLHDQGVVHRDLKPANIFIEHGHLKIGDYGLSRRLSASQADMTRGVGTPHYMAPEIGKGDYTRTIDIYACGVILYEMLTGSPPFDGDTVQEIIFKHIANLPDLSRLPPGFAPVLERALDKNPATRFASMQEFARAVADIGKPPGASSTIEYVPPKVKAHDTVVDPFPVRKLLARSASEGPAKPANDGYASGPLPREARGRLSALFGSLAAAPIIAAGCTVPWALFSFGEWSLLGRVFILSTLLSWAALVVARRPVRGQTTWGQRFNMLSAGMLVGLAAFWLDGWALPGAGTPAETSRDLTIGSARINPETLSTGSRYLFYFGLVAAAFRWWRLTDRDRRHKVRFWPVVAASVWAAVFLFLWPWEAAPVTLAFAPVVVAAVVVQVASPRQKPGSPLAA